MEPQQATKKECEPRPLETATRDDRLVAAQLGVPLITVMAMETEVVRDMWSVFTAGSDRQDDAQLFV
ncbi:MAG: hypothetical protein AAB909_03595 [Patescibacteria group bacterium]